MKLLTKRFEYDDSEPGYGTWDNLTGIVDESNFNFTNIDTSLQTNALTYETINRTIYIDASGNDTTGDGTVGNPYRQPLKAIQETKNVINTNVTITYQFSAGTFNWDSSCRNELSSKRVNNNGMVKFIGTLNLADTSTVILTQDASLPTKYGHDVSVGSNDLTDKFIEISGEYNPISWNDDSSLVSVETSLAGTRNIYEIGTTFYNLDDDANWLGVSLLNNNGQSIEFRNIYLENQTIAANSIRTDNDLYFKNCLFNSFFNILSRDTDKIKNTILSFEFCSFIASTAHHFQIKNIYSSLSLVNSAISSSSAKNLLFQDCTGLVLMKNVSLEKMILKGLNFSRLEITNNLTIRNVSTALDLRTGSRIEGNLFNTSLIFEGITQLILKSDPQVESSFLVLGIISTYGDYGILCNDLSGFKILEKNIIDFPNLYQKQSLGLEDTLVNNTTTSLDIGSNNQNSSIEVKYECTRDASIQTGTVNILNQASGLITIDSSIGADLGLSFSSSLSTNTIQLDCLLTDRSSTANFKYDIYRKFK